MSVYRKYRPMEHQVDALEALERALADDPRFEHMKKKEIEEAVAGFSERAYLRRDESHVAAFLAEWEGEPVDQLCFFPIEGLKLHRQVELAGSHVLPADAVELPEFIVELGPEIGSIIAVPCNGTSNRAMMRRAREHAKHGLRVLRAGLREHRDIHDGQLRFRLGTSYWFADGSGGWGTRAEDGIDLDLWEEAVEVAMSAPTSTLPTSGGNGVEQSANRALQWFERAQLATDPLVELLYLFFSLEGILGHKAEKLKGELLATRRAVLSNKKTGRFTHPGTAYRLYDEVRSAAVHGEDVPELSGKQVSDFAVDVRLPINEFLEFAREQGFAKRAHVLNALDEDPSRAEIRDRFLSG